jgi:GH24 family phage-related lysozyme (muramidase)
MTPTDPLADLAGPAFDAYLKQLDTWEGRCQWMYMDVPGNVTTGVGHLIAEADLASLLGFVGGDPAADWQAVKSASPGLIATSYQPLTTCRLPDPVIDALKHADLCKAQSEFLAAIPDSANWPITVRIACLDMSFNLGVGKFQAGYFCATCHFGPACRRGDWTTAAAQSARNGIQPSRNAYIAGLIRSAIAPSVLS